MGIVARRACILVEWYRPGLADIKEVADALSKSATAMAADGAQVQLLMTLAVPGDEVLFGIVGVTSPGPPPHSCRA